MQPITDWLGDADRIVDLGRRLRDASVRADRLALYRRTLHPEILGRVTVWSPDRPVEIFDRAHGLDLSVRFTGSPLDLAMTDGARRALDGDIVDRSAWRWADPFRGLGLTALVLRPLRGAACLVVGTRDQKGFAERELNLLDWLSKGLGEGRKCKNLDPQ
jgi:hypothetical protein